MSELLKLSLGFANSFLMFLSQVLKIINNIWAT